MDLENCGDGDHSTEIQLAWKKFEDVCSSLESEHTKLLDLETRRQKLSEDLERLRTEINDEKKYFHNQYAEELENVKEHCSSEQLDEIPETMAVDTDAIKEFIRIQKQELAAGDINDMHRKSSSHNSEKESKDVEQKRQKNIQNANYQIQRVCEDQEKMEDCKDDDTEIFDDFPDPIEREQFENEPK